METTLKSSTSDGLNKQWLSHIMSNKSNELRARGTRCVSLRLIMVQHAIQRRVHTLCAPFIPNSGKCKQVHGGETAPTLVC